MTGHGHAAGFGLVWDPDGILAGDLAEWAQRQRAGRLFERGPVTAFALPGAMEFAGGEEPASWTGPNSSAVWLGDLLPPETGETGEWLAAALAAGGPGGLQGLEGSFCIAVWDEARQGLLLYRDAACARNLYWHQGQGWAAVASQLQILVGMPGMPGVPDRVGPPGLHEYLRFLDVSPPSTIYRGIRAIEPGQPTWFHGDGLMDGAVSALDEPGRVVPARRGGPANPGFEASVDALDEALHAAVAARLERDGQTGVFLSGGIDSALLCAIAADIDRNRLETFTLGFDDARYDETPVAAAVAHHLGIPHHVVSYNLDDYAQAFDGFLAALDLPFADPAGLPTWLLYGRCRERVDVVLDGTGADTLLGVMPARHARFATQYAARLPVAVRRGLASLLRSIPGLARYAGLFDFEVPEDLLIRWHGWTAREIEALCGEPVDLASTRFFQIYRAFPANAHMERYSTLMGNLPDDRVHQAAQATGLRIRFPYADARVEGLVHSLPQEYRYSPGQPKRLLRALLARHVPSALWDQPKHGFDFPFVALMRHQDYALLRRYLAPNVLCRHGLLRRDTVDDYLGRFMRGDDSLGFRIWGLLILFGWLER